MTSTPEATPEARLTAARLGREALDRELVAAVVAWAAAHPADDDEQHDVLFGDRPAHAAGEGAPLVSEFAVCELATILHCTVQSATATLAECLELVHRLPRVHQLMVTGKLPAWRPAGSRRTPST